MQCVIRKLNDGIQPLADRIMTLVLQLIQSAGKTSTVLEDAFLVVGSLASGNILLSLFLPYTKQFSTHSTRIQLHTLHPSLPALPVPCSESTRRYSALHSGCRHYRRYLACSWWTKCPICEPFHDRFTRKSAKWRVESKRQDFYFVMLWWYCSCYWSLFRALSWDYDGCTSSSWCGWAKPCKSVFSFALPSWIDMSLWSWIMTLWIMSGNYVKVFLRPTLVSSRGWRRPRKVYHLLSVRRCFILTCCPVTLILPHSQSILDLVRRCLADDERSDALMRLSYGLIGDLADSFPAGQLKQLLLHNWVASELRSRHRMPDETKKTMRWAREVCISWLDHRAKLMLLLLQMVKIATQ